ncbi:MAG: hypothetical protein ACREJ5_30425, partial [Geminicoccaceae bacterium]
MTSTARSEHARAGRSGLGATPGLSTESGGDPSRTVPAAVGAVARRTAMRAMSRALVGLGAIVLVTPGLALAGGASGAEPEGEDLRTPPA